MDTVKNFISRSKTQDETSNQTAGHTGVFSGEGSHLASARDTTGTSSGLTGSNTTGQTSGIADSETTGTGQQQSLQKDAPTGGVGGVYHSERENLGVSDAGYTGNNATGSPHYYTGPAGTAVGGTHNSDIANRLDHTVDNSGTAETKHHLGNEEALGGTGSGVHGERENLGSSNTGYTGNTPTGAGSHFTGPRGTAVPGPHSTDTANRLDPSANTSASGTEHTGLHASGHGTIDKHYVGRDAAVGAGGAGLAEHEHNKHQNERGAGITGPTGIEHSTAGMQHNTTGTSHLERDAAVGAGTAGYVGHEPKMHENERDIGTTRTHDAANNSGHHVGRDAAVGAGGVGLAEHEHRNHENERDNERTARLPGSTDYPTSGTHDHTKDHHVGRDAAVVAGGVGLAEHEYHKHQQDSTYLPGPAPNTAGPHKKDWMNKLDPRVDAHPDVPQTTGHGPLKVDAAKVPETRYPEHSTHHGRDAAAVSGIGGAAYEADKHHNKHETGAVGAAGNTTGGPHSLDIANNADSTVNRDRSKDHQFVRDVATVGIFGGTAHEANKNHNKHETGALGTTAQSTTTGPRSSNIANKADPAVDSDHSKDQHYGHDAAVASDVGGAAYGADKHHEHDKEEKRKGGLLSFLHRDKNKKYTPEEEAEFGRQESEHHATNTGSRVHDVGHSSFGVSGATVGAPSGTRTNTFTGIADDGHAGSHAHPPHRLGKDAAVGAGGAGLAEHEHQKHEAVGQHNTTSNTASGIQSHTLGTTDSETGYRRDNTTSGIGSNTEYPHNTTSNTNTIGINNPTISDDRNRLHKELPAGYVAHVPAIGAEREIREGEKRLGDDTGVANPHELVGNGSEVNATSNY